jgi:DNA-binding GntR family transcriptional regulator
VEPFAAGLAASQITPNELQEIRGICKAWRAIVDEIKNSGEAHATKQQMIRWNANERRFHELIIQASRNFWLIKIIDDLQVMAFSFNPQRGLAEFLNVENAELTYRDHLRMAKALRRGDAVGIRQLAKRHIRLGRDKVLAFLEQQNTQQHTPE